MVNDNSILNYKPCIKCEKGLSKAGSTICKGCMPKKEYNRTLNKSLRKTYLNKFGYKNSAHDKGIVIENNNSVFREFVFNYKEITFPKNTKSSVQFFTLYWDQFNDFDKFSSFITKSGQIGTTYLVLNSSEMQKKSKFQYYIQSEKEKVSSILSPIQVISPTPFSRPLQFLTQKSYWSSLIASYFQHLHPIVSFFSIHSINTKITSESLLSAIYYGGFQYMNDKPPELIKYFNEYAKLNIKIAVSAISLQNTQALSVYSIVLLFIGDYTLSQACQANAIRMCYSLGLHLNSKRFSSIQQYNRKKLFSCIWAFHICLCGMSDLALNHLTEIDYCNIEISETDYQIPNSGCDFYFNTEDENIVYGICVDIYAKFRASLVLSSWNLNNCSESSLQTEIDNSFNDVSKKYTQYIMIYDVMLKKFPHLESRILNHKFELALMYHELNLERYRVLKSKVKKLNPSQVEKMLKECCSLFDTIFGSREFIQVSFLFHYTAGLNFISLYPMASSSQRLLIKQKLGKIVNFLSNRSITDKLLYLIIKNEYESIIKS